MPEDIRGDAAGLSRCRFAPTDPATSGRNPPGAAPVAPAPAAAGACPAGTSGPNLGRGVPLRPEAKATCPGARRRLPAAVGCLGGWPDGAREGRGLGGGSCAVATARELGSDVAGAWEAVPAAPLAAFPGLGGTGRPSAPAVAPGLGGLGAFGRPYGLYRMLPAWPYPGRPEGPYPPAAAATGEGTGMLLVPDPEAPSGPADRPFAMGPLTRPPGPALSNAFSPW